MLDNFLFLAQANFYTLAADLVLAGVVAIALKVLWKAYRSDREEYEEKETALVKRIEELTEMLDKVQENRIKEALEREDKQHLVIQQYSSRLQDLATAISQLQYAVMISLRPDLTKANTSKLLEEPHV